MQANPWFSWAQELQALAQSGIHYTENVFDKERYEKIRAIALQMMAAQSDLPVEQLTRIFNTEEGYATPKVDVRGVVFKDGKLLFVKELSDGAWTLPGGWVDVNEPPSLAVEREVFEESGYVVKARKIAAVYDRDCHPHTPYIFHLYKLFILCELVGGEAATSIETGGAEFYAPDALPILSIARTDPARPTDFD